MPIINSMAKFYVRRRAGVAEDYLANGRRMQEDILLRHLKMAADTEIGKRYDFNSINDPKEFSKRLPINGYEAFRSDIERMMNGAADILWPGKIDWYAKSSGTTGGKSKFLPVTNRALDECHYQGGRDALGFFAALFPDSMIFTGKGLIMGGSHKVHQKTSGVRHGDISAVMMQNLPMLARYFNTPELEVSLMDDWEAKIDTLARKTIDEKVTNISGVPTWTMVLFQKLFELSGKDNVKAVWPDLELYVHGGVSFVPYREQFKKLVGGLGIHYLETYNASEGFFAVQDLSVDDGMLLMLDYGIFYEFIPEEEFHKDDPETITYEDLEVGKIYAPIISTSSGLWRYDLGDTIEVIGTEPLRIKVAGRTKHFINAFGEEVMVGNTDRALGDTCKKFGIAINDYTVAPVYMGDGSKGCHEWLIECPELTGPDSESNNQIRKLKEDFRVALDSRLRELNSDYDAKRFKDMVLEPLRIHWLEEGTFYRWMQNRGKLGGQNKVPRLSNDRKYVDDILEFVAGA